MKRIMAVTAFIFLMTGVCMTVGVSAALADENVRNCAVCHSDKDAIYPQDHVTVKDDGIETCRECHGEDDDTPLDWIVHFNHVAKSKLKGDCLTCHKNGPDGKMMAFGQPLNIPKADETTPLASLKPYYQSWGQSELLDHVHAENKVTCRACHGQAVPDKGVNTAKCLNCHGTYKELAEKADVHFIAMSPHFGDGRELGCEACHTIHKKPETVCSKCHS